MDGVLVIDKPAGPTSHDVVARMRRVLGERRIGHTGTLDPAATGVLPLVIGRATRLARFLSASHKSYDAVVRLGFSTDTCDAAGQPVGGRHGGPLPSPEEIAGALAAFHGTFEQRPPAFSAKKIAGTRSYALARQRAGADAPPAATPEPVQVTVHALEILRGDGDLVTLRLTCSAGFYVRSLAHDLGARLGTGAHLAALRRTRSGEFDLSGALPLATAEQDAAAARAAVIPMERLLPALPSVVLSEAGLKSATCGRDLGPSDASSRWPGEAGSPGSFDAWRTAVRLLDPAGQLVGVAFPSERPGFLHPAVVLM